MTLAATALAPLVEFAGVSVIFDGRVRALGRRPRSLSARARS
jgi:hypothetical protein